MVTVDINKELAQLDELHSERNHTIVGRTLDYFVQCVRVQADELARAVEDARSERALQRRLLSLVSENIEQAADGNITVPEYVQKALSRQEIFVFVGTHWMLCHTQEYYDFVKAACYKAGLNQTYVENPEFMNRMFETVAFRVSQHRELAKPRKAVWINMQNGTLEVKEDGGIVLREHRKEDFFRYALPYAYDPDADCERWKAFLDEVLPDKDSQEMLMEFAAYCLTQGQWLQKMLVLLGSGANGKSVATEVLTRVFGQSNVSHVDLEKVTNDDNHRVLIENKLVNISQENGPSVAYSTLKNLVTGEEVMVKSLYKDVRPIGQYGKFIACYNALPKMENTYGFYRRIIIIPFDVTIPEGKRDTGLTKKLCEELPGILNMMLDCLQRLLKRGNLIECKASVKAMDEYKLNSNSVLRFFDERCVLAEDGMIQLKELFAEYKNFCHEENVKNPFGRNNFKKQLQTVGVTTRIVNGLAYLNVKYK